MWALQRKLAQAGVPLQLQGVGVVCHHHQEQVTQGYVRNFNLTRNPVDKDGSTAAIVEEGRMHPRKALEVVGKFITDNNAIATTDIGNTSSTANSYLRFNNPKRHISTLTFGNTGFAYQAALGAQLACPEDLAVAIVGDGAWGMSLFEVPTACQYNLPVIATVYNNGAWCAEKKNQIDFYDRFDHVVLLSLDPPTLIRG